MLPFLLFPVGVVLMFLFVKWKSGRAKAYMEKYFEERGMNATVLPGWMPPLRHWLRNRKGDDWVKIQMVDGSEKWARIRNKWLGGEPVDFFD